MTTLKEFEDALREQGMHMALAILQKLREFLFYLLTILSKLRETLFCLLRLP